MLVPESELDVDSFDPSPELNHGKLASYEWGTGELKFSPEASLRKQIFMTSMVEICQGVTSLEDKGDLLCLVSLVHEYRHFQQDYLTGLGNWDYTARIDATIARLGLCKNMSDHGSIVDGYRNAAGLHDLSGEAVVLGRPASEEIRIIADVFENELGVPGEYAKLFTSRRILEADAVLYTENLIDQLGKSRKSAEMLEEMRPAFRCLFMPEVYSDTITFCLRSLLETVIDDEPLKERVIGLTGALRVILNLCLMHPSPRYLDASGQERHDYIPGVRFLRLLRAMAQRMQDPSPQPNCPEALDADLCARTGFRYPTYRASLQSWHEHLKSLAPDPFPEVTRARVAAVEQRLFTRDGAGQPSASIYRPVFLGEAASSMVDYDLPLFATRTDGGEQPMLMTNRSILDNNYAVDRKRAALAWRLASLATGTRKSFTCPMATLAHCRAKTDRCLTPFDVLEDLPVVADCRANSIVRDPNRGRLIL